MTALPPVPEVTVMVPLPFVGDEVTEYVALSVAPETGPLGTPISSAPAILPVGVAPSPENSPEKTTTPNVAGQDAKPADAPYSALSVHTPAAWRSPHTNTALASHAQ